MVHSFAHGRTFCVLATGQPRALSMRKLLLPLAACVITVSFVSTPNRYVHTRQSSPLGPSEAQARHVDPLRPVESPADLASSVRHTPDHRVLAPPTATTTQPTQSASGG